MLRPLEGDVFSQMSFLYLLEDLRNPVVDFLMQMVTHFGDEMIFMGVAMLFLWCIDKTEGYYILTIGFLGTQINQLLKVLFRIDRPWVKDPEFTIVESAREAASGYSFPSGHTQCGVGVFGAIARIAKKRWLRNTAIALCVLIPFSRMWLGVHTPLDVGVSFVLALVMVFGLYPLIHKAAEKPDMMRMIFAVLLIWSLAQVLFMEFFPFPADANGAELFSGKKNAYKMLGAVLGFNIVFELDQRFIRYEIDGCFWNRAVRFVLGLALSLGVKELSGALFDLLPGGYAALTGKAFSYMLVVIFAGAVWPMTFKYFKKLEDKFSAKR